MSSDNVHFVDHFHQSAQLTSQWQQ